MAMASLQCNNNGNGVRTHAKKPSKLTKSGMLLLLLLRRLVKDGWNVDELRIL